MFDLVTLTFTGADNGHRTISGGRCISEPW